MCDFGYVCSLMLLSLNAWSVIRECKIFIVKDCSELLMAVNVLYNIWEC